MSDAHKYAKAEGKRLTLEVLKVLDNPPVTSALDALTFALGAVIAKEYNIEGQEEILDIMTDRLRFCVFCVRDKAEKKDIH